MGQNLVKAYLDDSQSSLVGRAEFKVKAKVITYLSLKFSLFIKRSVGGEMDTAAEDVLNNGNCAKSEEDKCARSVEGRSGARTFVYF